jgi:hypothetical protein
MVLDLDLDMSRTKAARQDPSQRPKTSRELVSCQALPVIVGADYFSDHHGSDLDHVFRFIKCNESRNAFSEHAHHFALFAFRHRLISLRRTVLARAALRLLCLSLGCLRLPSSIEFIPGIEDQIRVTHSTRLRSVSSNQIS